MSLALQYGLEDMEITPDADIQCLAGQISVEEEFASYTLTLSHPTADVLTFWKVSHY